MFPYYCGAKRVSVSGTGAVVRRYVGKQQAGVRLMDQGLDRQHTYMYTFLLFFSFFFLLLYVLEERGRTNEIFNWATALVERDRERADKNHMNTGGERERENHMKTGDPNFVTATHHLRSQKDASEK